MGRAEKTVSLRYLSLRRQAFKPVKIVFPAMGRGSIRWKVGGFVLYDLREATCWKNTDNYLEMDG